MPSRSGGVSRRLVAGSVILAATVVIGLAAVALTARREHSGPGVDTAATVRTTTVARVDLSDTESFAGTLGYGGARTVKGAGTGLLTRLPTIGDTMSRGKALYWVNDVPVPVFIGETPLFRTLDKPGTQGRDVSMVVENLTALGYATGTAGKGARGEATWTATLANAVRRWQQDSGLPPTGTLSVGQVVVFAEPVRVSAVTAQLGDEVAGELMSVTATAKRVTVSMDPTQITKVKIGTEVTVVLPTNAEIAAKVSTISQTVTGGGSDDPAGQLAKPQLAITVTPANPQDVASLESAAVQVRLTTSTRPGVLAVPVGALIALRDGGYAVQLPDGRLLAVETGMFARELVEISGTGIVDGLRVVTAS